jgi:Fe-S-cluster containining protein
MDISKIPEHKSCKNCGSCCGPVIINEKEQKDIIFFVQKNKPRFNKNASFIDCKFRVDNRCSIYSVRPTVCRLMGVTIGMTCEYGNSKMLDGYKFMNMEIKTVGFLNEAIKTNY